MPMITLETARDIAFAYREVETAQRLLAEIKDALDRQTTPDLRDAFGRRRGGLQLGVPSGNDSTRLFDVPFNLARPIIEAHIAQQSAIIVALSERARIELDGAIAPASGEKAT